MPGPEWKRPNGDESNGVEGEGSPAIARRRELTAEEVEAKVVDLELALALDSSTRLSCARGGSPAEAQSTPNLFPSEFRISVGESVLRLGNIWRIVVCGLATVLVVVGFTTFLVASTLLTFGLAMGSLFVIPCAVGVLAHTGWLNND